MFNSKALRASVRSKILTAIAGAPFDVVFGIKKKRADRYVVFTADTVTNMDGRDQLDLEVNVVAPMSDEDAAEAAADAIIGGLDRSVAIEDGFAYYIYKSTRNRVEGSDPHTVRYRCTFDLYVYERTE